MVITVLSTDIIFMDPSLSTVSGSGPPATTSRSFRVIIIVGLVVTQFSHWPDSLTLAA